MIIAYYSRTGNVEDFLDWYLMPVLGERFEARNIEEWDFVDEPYILITPTYSTEEITEEVADWLKRGLRSFYEIEKFRMRSVRNRAYPVLI